MIRLMMMMTMMRIRASERRRWREEERDVVHITYNPFSYSLSLLLPLSVCDFEICNVEFNIATRPESSSNGNGNNERLVWFVGVRLVIVGVLYSLKLGSLAQSFLLFAVRLIFFCLLARLSGVSCLTSCSWDGDADDEDGWRWWWGFFIKKISTCLTGYCIVIYYVRRTKILLLRKKRKRRMRRRRKRNNVYFLRYRHTQVQRNKCKTEKNTWFIIIIFMHINKGGGWIWLFSLTWYYYIMYILKT